MKTPARGSRIVSYVRRVARWTAAGFIPALATTLPNCVLNRSWASVTATRYTTSAVFRNAAGQTFTVTDADATFAGSAGALRRFGLQQPLSDGSCPAHSCDEAFVQKQWLDYLARRFAEGSDPANAGHEAFEAHYGAGPYCLVAGSATISRTMETITSLGTFETDRAAPDECSATMETGCGNAPGVVPVLGLAPASGIDFGSHPVGSSAGPQGITLSNAGAGRLCLDGARLNPASANPGDFTVDASGCRPLPGEETRLGRTILSASGRTSCTVTVDFRPGDPGARAADLVITSSDPTTPNATLALRGTGEPGVLTVTPNPVCLNVPEEVIDGMACRRRLVTLGNAGPGMITVRSAATGASATNWSVRFPPDATPPFTIPVGGMASPWTVLECGGVTPEDSTLLTINSNSTTPSVLLPMVGPTTACTP